MRPGGWRSRPLAVILVTGSCFLLLFGPGLLELVGDWLREPEYRHGFLLFGVSLYLVWRDRHAAPTCPARRSGTVVVGASVALFLVASAMAEHFSMRFAALLALAGLVVYHRGWTQLRAWWLPFVLMVFAIPLPQVVLGTLTLPLQLFASRSATALLRFRHVPAAVAGNIIQLPGHQLFVAQACSGLRSLSALFGLTLLLGGTWLTGTGARVGLLLVALPVAIVANVLRIFVTGFGVYFVGPEFAAGAMHESAGILVFVVAFGGLALLAWLLRRREARMVAS